MDVVRDEHLAASFINSKSFMECYLDKLKIPTSPGTPTSVLQDFASMKTGEDCSIVKAIKKLSPIDVKRLSIHMYPLVARQVTNNFNLMDEPKMDSKVIEDYVRVVEHGELDRDGVVRVKMEVLQPPLVLESIEVGDEMQSAMVPTTPPPIVRKSNVITSMSPSLPELNSSSANMLVPPPMSTGRLVAPQAPPSPLPPPQRSSLCIVIPHQHPLPPPPTMTSNVTNSLSPAPPSPPLSTLERTKVPLPPPILPMSATREVTPQQHPLPPPASPMSATHEVTPQQPPPPPPPPLMSATRVVAPQQPPLPSIIGPPPPPPMMTITVTKSLSPAPPSPPQSTLESTKVPLPPPPPPPSPMSATQEVTPQQPPPSPPMSVKPPLPPIIALPPPPSILGKLGPPLPPPPPPFQHGKGGAPPPLPPCVVPTRSLRPKPTTKLKRSSQMGSLYRLLKGKLEGSNLDGKSLKRTSSKIRAASNGNGKQGMADALAEMTKRSSYFIQIEEDVKNYANVIKELKTALISFQTTDMNELMKFHNYVESHMEKLTDETQVLARFEDFPAKKLEGLRMAAALYAKLDAIAASLQNWKIESPVHQQIDKVENYFNKIKGELDTLDRTKDDELKKFKSQNIHFDFTILVRIKELMVEVSSNCMELALKETRGPIAKECQDTGLKCHSKKTGSGKILWRAFQLAFRVYTFAGGQDDRANFLTRELAQEIQTNP